MQLEDFLVNYPDPNDNNIQELVTAKKEFNELGATAMNERSRLVRYPLGDFYPHQELRGRFIRVTPRMFVLDEAGSGKSASMIRISEEFRQRLQENKPDAFIKKAIVLVKGPTLEREFRYQILCVATDGRYLTPAITNPYQTRQSRQNNITREINKWYTISTYTRFSRRILGKPSKKMRKADPTLIQPMSDQRIIDEFSNTLFFVDEVHNLRIDETEGGDFETITVPIEEEEGVHYEKKRVKKIKESYTALHRVFSLIKKSVIVLASATPMINDPKEFGPLINLLLPPNRQMSQSTIDNISNLTLDQMNEYVKGKVVYVRGLQTGAIPIYEGERIKLDTKTRNKLARYLEATKSHTSKDFNIKTFEPQTKVYKSYMVKGGIQDITYQKVQQYHTNIYLAERQVSSFVFPDGSYGSSKPRANEKATGFYKYVIPPNRRRGIDFYKANDELQAHLRDMNKLRKLSTKYAKIVELCKVKNSGNCFIYTEFDEIGAVMLGLCFEAQGFERFNETDSVFTTKTSEGGAALLPPVCLGIEENKIIKRDFKPAPRYVILTSDIMKRSKTYFETAKELFNSPENMHGDYIKIYIGSPTSRDGINLSNVLQIHLASAAWNPSGTHQALSRAIRATSHNDLLEEKRKSLPPEERDNVTIDVKVYKHAAVGTDADDKNMEMSTDIYMYLVSEPKEINIKYTMRKLKQCALDGQINYLRNVRIGDQAGSPECDYQSCTYKCISPAPPGISPVDYSVVDPSLLDYSTYDLYYIEPLLKEIQEKITTLFSVNVEEQLIPISNINLAELYNMADFETYEIEYINRAIEQLLNNRNPINSRFGYPSYFHYGDNNELFISREFPVYILPIKLSGLGYYTENLISIKSSRLKEYVDKTVIVEKAQQELIDIKEITDLDELGEALLEIPIQARVKLLEDAIDDIVKNTDTAFDRLISEYYLNKYLFVEHEPVTELQALREQIQRKKAAPGPKTAKIKALKTEQFTFDNNTERVYINDLYDQEKATGYGGLNKIQTIRILKPSEGLGWRPVKEDEWPVYERLIRERTKTEHVGLENKPLTGVVKGGKFKIQRTYANVSAKKDKRGKHGGIDCTSLHLSDLYNVIYQLQIPPPKTTPITETFTNERRENVIKYLKQREIGLTDEEFNKLTNEDLEFYYNWVSSQLSKARLCQFIQDYMNENQLLEYK